MVILPTETKLVSATLIASENWRRRLQKAKRMEVGFVAGAVPKSWVQMRKTSCWRCGNCFGRSNGRDGVGGQREVL